MTQETTARTDLAGMIPDELRNPPLWLQYYIQPNPEKPDKKPTKHPCVKWSTPEFRKANLRPLDALLKRSKQAGFQRWVDKSEGFVYVDLDSCRNAETGTIEPWARAIIEKLDSYTEISASGSGLHIVCRGSLPEDFHIDPHKVEIYSGHINKLIAMTGNVLDWYATIEDRQPQLEELLAKMKAETKPTETKPPEPSAAPRQWRDVFHLGSEMDDRPSRVLIKGILEEGICFFGALSGTGKTWIGLSIAHALISGQPLFGVFPVIERVNVLYLVPEMGGRKFRERMIKMRLPMDGCFYCQTIRDGACDLEDPVLLQAIHMMQPVVILDTAIRFQQGDENVSTQQAQGLGAKMFKLIGAGAPAIVGMHHRKKDMSEKTSPPSLENTLRGTGDFGAQADCVWCVEHARRKEKDGHGFESDYTEESKELTRLTLTCVKPRDMEPADPFTIQGRPYIDQLGDFKVIDTFRSEPGRPEDNTPGDVEKVVSLVAGTPSIGILAIRGRTGFGADRITRILKENQWAKVNGLWTRQEMVDGLDPDAY